MALITLRPLVLSSFFVLLLLVNLPEHVHSDNPNIKKNHKPKFKPGPWSTAHATFYGEADGSGTMGGACGYADHTKLGYGTHTVALTTGMFNGGQTCGACYEVKCVGDNKQCKPGNPSVFVTATNLCGECFDLAQPGFLQIAHKEAGRVPVHHRRVPCKWKGGIRFTIEGNPNFNMVSVTNVAGAGDVVGLLVKGDHKVKWTPLRRNWGQKWETSTPLVGEALTFRVITSDGRKSTSWRVTPKNWQFGKTYEGKNFSF